MDAETIQKIAAELAKHMAYRDWWQWLVQILLVAVSAGIGAYLSEYLKTKEKNLARFFRQDGKSKFLLASSVEQAPPHPAYRTP